MRSQQLGPISCWSQTAHPGRGPAGWSGSPLPSAHTEPPQGQVLLSPQSGHHCAGAHKHRGVKVEGAIVGEMPETNTPETHAHGGLVGEEAAPETGQPSRPCTMVPLTCSLPPPRPPGLLLPFGPSPQPLALGSTALSQRQVDLHLTTGHIAASSEPLRHHQAPAVGPPCRPAGG